MMTRWHQVGTFSPFFRAHGHIDTKRREVYLYDQPYQGIMRDAIRLRYSLLPVLYTAFYENTLSGVPTLRCVRLLSTVRRRGRSEARADFPTFSSSQAAVRRLPRRRQGPCTRRPVLLRRLGPARQARRRGGRHLAGGLHLGRPGALDFPYLSAPLAHLELM